MALQSSMDHCGPKAMEIAKKKFIHCRGVNQNEEVTKTRVKHLEKDRRNGTEMEVSRQTDNQEMQGHRIAVRRTAASLCSGKSKWRRDSSKVK